MDVVFTFSNSARRPLVYSHPDNDIWYNGLAGAANYLARQMQCHQLLIGTQVTATVAYDDADHDEIMGVLTGKYAKALYDMCDDTIDLSDRYPHMYARCSDNFQVVTFCFDGTNDYVAFIG